MRPKALALPLEIAAQAVVIEPCLADRDDPRMACELHQLRRIHRGVILVVRMHADGREEIIVSLGERQHLGKPGEGDADAQRVRHAVRAHLFPHFVHLAVVFQRIKMAVRIDPSWKIRGGRRPRARFPVHGRATSR